MKKIGIIGHSTGNGHIYSWPAIINGFDIIKIKECGYPIIIQYLDAEYKVNVNLKNYEVTNIWTQARELSEKVAAATNIRTVDEKIRDLVDAVDYIIIARDDYRYNLRLARIILSTEKNLLIDKPIATKESSFKKIYGLQRYKGQLFTCSGCRYSNDLSINRIEKGIIGKTKRIIAEIPKGWDKYGIHVLTAGYNIVKPSKVDMISKKDSKRLKMIKYKLDEVEFIVYNTTDLNQGINLVIEGTTGNVIKKFNDSYNSFTKLLEEFVYGIEHKREMIPYEETAVLIRMIEFGLK